MKNYVIFIALCFVPAAFGAFAGSINDILHANEATCAALSGASDQSIELARQAKQFPESPEMNKFAKCLLEKYNVMGMDGSINPDIQSYRIITDVPDNTRRISEICTSLRGNDAQDTARLIANCYLSHGQLILGLTPRTS